MAAVLVEQVCLPTKLLYSLQEIGSWRKFCNVHSLVFATRSTSSKVKCEQTYTHVENVVILESYICLFSGWKQSQIWILKFWMQGILLDPSDTNRLQWWEFVNVIMDFKFTQNKGNSKSWALFSFSRMTHVRKHRFLGGGYALRVKLRDTQL